MAPKRPHPKNYAMYDAKGKAKYQADLRKYLADKKAADAKKPVAKKPTAKKPVAKKPVAKKPVAKKPVAKKPVAKKPVAKKPVAKKPVAKKPVAKKPVPKKTTNNLKIKKAANTTRKALKKAAPVVKKAAKTVVKKASEAKQAVGKRVNQVKKIANKKSPNKRPTTAGQKLASKGNKFVKSGVKQGGRNLVKLAKGIAKDPKSLLKGAKGAGISYVAERAASGLINRAFKPKGMKQSEYAKKLQEMKGKRNIVKSVKNIASKIRGKSNKPSTNKPSAPAPASKLKIAKDRVRKAKGYNKEKLQREVTMLEKMGKQGRTWSNPVGAKGKGKPSSVKQEPKKTTRQKRESKYIKTASGSLARRGTVAARRAENREKARKRAQEMARRRLANK